MWDELPKCAGEVASRSSRQCATEAVEKTCQCLTQWLSITRLKVVQVHTVAVVCLVSQRDLVNHMLEVITFR
jgi:hypothetical protein